MTWRKPSGAFWKEVGTIEKTNTEKKKPCPVTRQRTIRRDRLGQDSEDRGWLLRKLNLKLLRLILRKVSEWSRNEAP